MTNYNPLIEKYNELHKKNEEKKPEKGETTLGLPIKRKSMFNESDIRYHPYDMNSNFLKIADEVRQGNIQITSISVQHEVVGSTFPTGFATITIECHKPL